jgi:hypothetical protein
MTQEIRTGTLHIAWDDTWHRIEVDGYLLNLSPTQYRVCRAFLSVTSLTSGAREFIILTYLPYEELQEETDLSHRILVKHISNINARIAASGLQICSFQDGYILAFSSLAKKAQKREPERNLR